MEGAEAEMAAAQLILVAFLAGAGVLVLGVSAAWVRHRSRRGRPRNAADTRPAVATSDWVPDAKRVRRIQAELDRARLAARGSPR